MLVGLNTEQANRVLARIGAVAGEVRREGPKPHYSYSSPEAVSEAWKVVQKTVDPSTVVFTIAHNIYGDHISDHRCRYQLRCWRIMPNTLKRGQALNFKEQGQYQNFDDLLFETLVEEPPTRKCECCWHNTLRDAGVTNIGNADEHSKSWREAGKPYWRRRLIIGSDYKGEFSFDVLEYVGTGKEESEPAKSQA
jgi:hypothetical protein